MPLYFSQEQALKSPVWQSNERTLERHSQVFAISLLLETGMFAAGLQQAKPPLLFNSQ